MIAKKIRVSGIAIRPGLSKNGILYTAEELRDFIPSMFGKPILKDHNSTVDNTVGLVESAYDTGGSVVGYKGWVKEDGTGLIERIDDGRIKEVSIGAFVSKLVKENDDDEHLIAIGLEGMELSLTPTPAVKGTSLQKSLESIQKNKLDKSVPVLAIAENTKLFVENSQINSKEEKEMSEEELKPEEEEKKEEPEATPEAEEPKAEEEKEAEEPEAEPEKKEDTATESTVKIKVDSSDLDKALAKAEKLGKITEDLNKKEVKETKTKGKVVKEQDTAEAQKDAEGEYTLEESNSGFSLWKQPKADGRLM